MSARSDQIALYARTLDAIYPPGPDSSGKIIDLGKDYTTYMNKHPNADPVVIFEAVKARAAAAAAVLGGVPVTIGKAVTGIGAATAQIGQGTGLGAAQYFNSLPSWLKGFLTANGVMRIVEGALGILIIGVSVAKLTGSANPVVNIVKGVTKK